MKCRIYIDEVGNSDLGSSHNSLHRFLSLTGVIIDLEYVDKILHHQMEDLKSDYFKSHPDEPVILHRKELVNAKYPFKALKDEKVKKRFDRDLLNLLQSWEYTVITVCLDKLAHKETYQIWRYDPYYYCLAILLERYTFYLEQKQQNGDVMAESRGGKEDKRLKDSFSKLWNEGTNYILQDRIQTVLTSKQLKVKSKLNNISGLQLADIIAHPSRNEILFENGVLENLAPFSKLILRILQSKYYKHNGIIHGKKFIKP